MANSLSGFGYFFRGMGLLTQPGLRRFVIIPLLANVAVFALMASAIYQAMSGLYIEYSSNIGRLGVFRLDSHTAYLAI